MNDPQAVNRIENDLNRWLSKEQRFIKLFSSSISKDNVLLKEKLQYFNSIAAKYKGTTNLDERFALRMLRQERSQLEKQLYPNLWIRFLNKLFVPIQQQVAIKQLEKQAGNNRLLLKDNLELTGFDSVIPTLDQQMKRGQQQFSIPVSYYVNEKEHMDYALSFIKDINDQYRLEGYNATLRNELKPEEIKHHYFKPEQAISAQQAYNLLAGRSIEREQMGINPIRQSTWIQLDFNDKDPQGNYRIKQFTSTYGYDLQKELQQLPLKELLNKEQTEKLLDALTNGKRESVSFLKDGKERQYYIEANPQFKSVNIYDGHSRKVTLSTALGNKTIEAVKLTRKINESQEVKHLKRKGIRTN